MKQIYNKHGVRGFYKGITASYVGVTETVIHFVIYEGIKARLREYKGTQIYEEQRSMFDFVEFMAAGATSKTIATCVAYPHGRFTGIVSIRWIKLIDKKKSCYRTREKYCTL